MLVRVKNSILLAELPSSFAKFVACLQWMQRITNVVNVRGLYIPLFICMWLRVFEGEMNV